MMIQRHKNNKEWLKHDGEIMMVVMVQGSKKRNSKSIKADKTMMKNDRFRLIMIKVERKCDMNKKKTESVR